MKYLFRDKPIYPCYNLEFHAYGVVNFINEGIPNDSLKDYGVIYVNPFNISIERAWRSYDEIELIFCEEGTEKEFEYDSLLEKLNKMDKQQ